MFLVRRIVCDRTPMSGSTWKIDDAAITGARLQLQQSLRPVLDKFLT